MPGADPEPKKSAPLDSDPELFPNGPCDTAMPVKETIESFDFGQFVDLVVVPDNSTDSNAISDKSTDQGNHNYHNLIIHKIPDNVLKSLIKKRLDEKVDVKCSMADVLGGVPITDLLKGKVEDSIRPIQIKDVRIPDIDNFLTTREIHYKDKSVKMDLDDEQVTDLLGGNSILVPPILQSDNTFVRLVPETKDAKTLATAPAVTSHTILNLSSFLNEPLVPGLNGKPYRIKLSPEIINDLRMKGTANITGKNNISLSVRRHIDR